MHSATELQLDLKEVEKTAQSMLGWRNYAVLRFINTTPWMGGDYDTATIRVARVGGSYEVESYALPSPSTVKGALRWVFRVALSCRKRHYSIKDLDTLLSPLLGGRAKLEDREGERHYDSLIRIRVNSSIINRTLLDQEVKKLAKLLSRACTVSMKRFKGENLSRILECIGFTLYSSQARRFFDPKSDCMVKGKHLLDQSLLNSINNYSRDSRVKLAKAYTIPRIQLLTMGIRGDDPKCVEKILANTPIPPGYVAVEVGVDYRAELEDVVGRELLQEVLVAVTRAIVYSFTALGLGRGATRGFGRFRVKEWIERGSKVATTAPTPKLIDQLRKGLVNRVGKVLDTVRALGETLEAGLEESVGEEIDRATGTVPCLDTAWTREVEVIHHPHSAPIAGKHKKGQAPWRPKPKPVVGDIYEALSAIGYATLKAVWKLYSGYDVFRSGAGFHTWLLGLPRWQQVTGYALLKEEEQVELLNECLEGKEVAGLVEEARRASPIVLLPIERGDTYSALIIVFPTEDHTSRLGRLVHVGRHGDPKNPYRHLVRVSYILRSREIQAPPDIHVEEDGCGEDKPGGIVKPLEKPGAAAEPEVVEIEKLGAANLVNKLLEAAVDHIVEALK